ncbi:hypothetical protein C8Q73DRAFT_97775 [Cubamyces lactineus]|nr:hypothetical protein C8Q73DRAFT_97775 [Cubamyces lactineus]
MAYTHSNSLSSCFILSPLSHALAAARPQQRCSESDRSLALAVYRLHAASPSSSHLPRPSSLRSLWDVKRLYSSPRSQPYATPAADSRHRGQPVQWGFKHRSVSRTIERTPSTSPPLYYPFAVLVDNRGRRAPGPGPRFEPSTSTQRSAAGNRHPSDMHVVHRVSLVAPRQSLKLHLRRTVGAVQRLEPEEYPPFRTATILFS